MPNVYRVLGDSTRRQILSMLKQGSKTQKEIVEAFDISQPGIKKHLNILLEEGIISESLNGKYRISLAATRIPDVTCKYILVVVSEFLWPTRIIMKFKSTPASANKLICVWRRM